jgi:metallo-beta-lactamase family protein
MGNRRPRKTFAELLQQQLGWQVTVPEYGHALRWPDFLAHE